jgi:hypothetical protein
LRLSVKSDVSEFVLETEAVGDVVRVALPEPSVRVRVRDKEVRDDDAVSGRDKLWVVLELQHDTERSAGLADSKSVLESDADRDVVRVALREHAVRVSVCEKVIEGMSRVDADAMPDQDGM